MKMLEMFPGQEYMEGGGALCWDVKPSDIHLIDFVFVWVIL